MLRNKFKPIYNNFEELKVRSLSDTLFRDFVMEKDVLAIMLSDEEKQYLATDYLTSDDFFSAQYRQLFELIKYKRSKSNNHITFFGYLEISTEIANDASLRSRFPLVTEALLSDLAVMFNNSTNFNFYLEKLLELTRLRALEAFYAETLSAFKNNSDITWQNSLNDFETFILENNERALKNSSFVDIDTATETFLEKIESIIHGDDPDIHSIFSGFDSIDRFTKGFKPGQFIILGARPGVGKTALALNIARNIIRDRSKSCAFISLEMPVQELIGRYYSSLANIELGKLQNPKYLSNLELNKLKNLASFNENRGQIYFDDVATSKITDIIWKIKQLSKDLNGGLSFVVVDYLQLVSGGSSHGTRSNEVAMISRTLKTLALDLKIPILALSQLSRNVENREDKRPQLIDLRESGGIEQDADIVIFLSRTILDKKKKDNEQKTEEYADIYKITEVTIAKNRSGTTGYADLIYEGRIVTFKEKERNE
ncbi:replicative DNA helicase [Mycoplasmopsis mustelae]|uniref:DNA 5'-3' helicase n=1 Tax=Mycoplasmopsis mustelae TaxID=171289 RepID=A0A4R7UFH1_9BACT|nr:DnaB-like helicase C-terminal domain-containing protein [Mycoplasmopsis mustelae]TDV24444.1 replicative DNA helicase [Mycoplasmopsis mustelae]